MKRRFALFAPLAALLGARKAHGQGAPPGNISHVVTGTDTSLEIRQQVLSGGGGCPDENGWGSPCLKGEEPGFRMRRNKADQCPVCGALAEPYVRPTEAAAFPADTCLPLNDGNTYAVCKRPSETTLVGPMERVTRCRNCTAAFYQDAKE